VHGGDIVRVAGAVGDLAKSQLESLVAQQQITGKKCVKTCT